MSLHLTGYRFSVYTWAVRMALAECGRKAGYTECDPFDPGKSGALLKQHPFGRVPVLRDGDFTIYETGAILAYLSLPERDPRRRARARQVAGIVDAYGYRPLVRQVFAHAVFRPASGEEPDPGEIALGLAAAPAVLAALDGIAAEGLALDGETVGAADCHLAPMIGYFTQAREGREMLARHPALQSWFAGISRRESYLATQPDLVAMGDDR